MNIKWLINRKNIKVGSKNSKKYESMNRRIKKWSEFSDRVTKYIDHKGPVEAESLMKQLEEIRVEVELKTMINGCCRGGSLVIEQSAE